MHNNNNTELELVITKLIVSDLMHYTTAIYVMLATSCISAAIPTNSWSSNLIYYKLVEFPALIRWCRYSANGHVGSSYLSTHTSSVWFTAVL